MAAVELTPADFSPWAVKNQEQLAELIGDILAQAEVVAPCIVDPEFTYERAAKGILREAVLRRLDAGSGAIVTRSEGTGPFSRSETVDTRSRRGILQPADITDLQRLCTMFIGEQSERLWAVDMDRGTTEPNWISARPDLWFQINVPEHLKRRLR